MQATDTPSSSVDNTLPSATPPMPRGSLRGQILAWSFIPAAIILLAVALVAFYSYQRVTGDLAIEQDRELARLSAGQLATELTEYTGNLTALSRSLAEHWQDQDALRRELSLAGNRLVVFDRGVILLDNYGTVIAAHPERPAILSQNWSDREYFHALVRNGTPVFSNVVTDGPAGDAVVIVAVPVTNDSGQLLGMAAGLFGVSATANNPLYGSIVRIRIAEDSAKYLVDAQGRVIYHTNSDLIGAQLSAQRAVTELMQGRPGAFRTTDVAGQQIVAAFASVPGTPWGLVTETAWATLLAPSRSYSQFLSLLLALGVIVPAIVTAIGVRRITATVRHLTDAAQEVANGKFGLTIPPASTRDMQELVSQFNRMSAQLSASYEALSNQNEQLSLVMRGTNDGMWDWDIRTDHIYFSPRWKEMLGYADGDIENRIDTWRSLIHPDDRERVERDLESYLAGRLPIYQVEHRLRHRDGSYRWILTRGIVLYDAEGVPYRMAGSHTDVTEGKRARDLLDGQRHFLEMLATGETLPETLDALVQVLEDQWPGMLTLVLLLDDEQQQLFVGSYGRLPAAFADALDGMEVGARADAPGGACFTGERVIVSDIAHDSRAARLQALALEHGLSACWSEPVRSSEGNVIGIFSVYQRAPRGPSPEELQTLETAAHLVGVAIEHKRAYQTLERRVAERTKELSALNAISTAVSRSLDMEEVLDNALAEVMQTLNVEAAALYLIDATGENFVGVAARGLSPEFTDRIGILPEAVVRAGRIFSPDEPITWTIEDYPAGPIKDAVVAEGIKTILGVPLSAKGMLVGALALGARQPRVLAAEEVTLLMAVGGQIGVAIENGRLYEAEQARRAEAERRRQVAEGMQEILAVLNSRQSLQETLEFIAGQACRVLGCDAAAIMSLDKATQTLSVQAHCSLPDWVAKQMQFKVGEAGAGRAVELRQSVVMADTAVELAKMVAAGQMPGNMPLDFVGAMAGSYKSLISVPLLVRGEPYGAISMYYREQRQITAEDVRLAESVGNQAGLAIESERLREQAESSAALAERNRLARELHDSVTQNLYSVTLYAEATARLMENGNASQAAEYLRDLRDTSQEALREMRLLIFELRPPELAKTGLAGALQIRLQSVEARGGMEADLQLEGVEHEARLPLGQQQELYQIAQEALNNTLKHAHADRVTVRLHYTPAVVTLEIADDGVGLALAEAEATGGMGLRNMRERAARIGAHFGIDTGTGKGACVRVILPMPAAEAHVR